MSKNHKRSKRLKSEKAKVKLKANTSVDRLPKGLNVTRTSFNVKKILIREQLKQQDETEVLSTRKLNIDVCNSIYIIFFPMYQSNNAYCTSLIIRGAIIFARIHMYLYVTNDEFVFRIY